jgi:glycerol kinase
MARPDLVLAVDQGSSSTKALLVDRDGAVVSSASVSLASGYPRPGWVEQSADEITSSVRSAVAQCLAGRNPDDVRAVGLSTQRESLLVWDRETGRPCGPVISWQDQRTAGSCERLLREGHGEEVRRRSGLPLDPMFSATKAQWLLDQVDPTRSRSRAGGLCLGTVDSWLLFAFGGRHLIEVGNAARTQLLNVHTRQWDADLLDLFRIPRPALPDVVASTGPFPALRGLAPLRDGTPVSAVLGDSHAALFAQAGWIPGTVKATYGTGSSVMGLCSPASDPGPGLCLTIAWEHGTAEYAVEGNIRSSGATLSWLARLFDSSPARLAALAEQAGSDGVHLVPGFTGLGAPWWDREAVGLISGLTLGTELPNLARAALESIAMQVEDVVAEVAAAAGPVRTLLADGGASANPTVMQLQADLSGRTVERAEQTDLSPLGAAHLAGLAAGVWSRPDVDGLPRDREVFTPRMGEAERRRARSAWLAAVERARGR